MDLDYDVIIIGGGPAGSSAAIRLRKEGINVALFEKEIFPRPHVGESLVPFCYDLFRELGILDELKKTAVRKPGVRFINKNGSQSTTYCFKNILNDENYLSFHVLREQFDKQLLDKAKKDGAAIFENHKVSNVDLSNPNQAIITVDNGETKKEFSSRFLIDATGQDSFLGKKMGLKSKHKDLDRIAFLQHWNCDTSQEGINEGLLQLIYLSTTKQGWMGLQPVDLNRLSVGIIFDNNYVKSAKQNYIDKGIADWKQQFYYDEITKSLYTKELLKSSKTINKLMVVGDYSYQISKKYDTNFALIGDAAGFLDPIFATGIYLALNTSKYVSESIITLLKDEAKGLEKMKESYAQYEGALELLERFINNFYNPDFINLAEIGEDIYKDDEEHAKRLIAFSLVHFLMGGDFYNEHKKYLSYLDFLQNPKQIARYHHLVINQEKYKENSCDMLSEDIFPMLQKIS
jgi:hypothetical protein